MFTLLCLRGPHRSEAYGTSKKWGLVITWWLFSTGVGNKHFDYLICNIRENAEISVYLLHWHFVGFTVPNTLDRVTFLVQK